MAESPVIRLRRSSDSMESDFYMNTTGSVITTGKNGTGTTLATWLGASTAYVRTWYDQSGKGNHATQTEPTRQPIFYASTPNNYITFALNKYLNLPAGTVPYSPLSYTVSAKHAEINNTQGGICATGKAFVNYESNSFRRNDGAYRQYWWSNDFDAGTYASGNTVTWVYDASTQETVMYVNGTSVGSMKRTTWACPKSAGFIGNTPVTTVNETLNGTLYRVYLYPRALTAAQRQTIETATNITDI